jgi:hypothetical protein
MAFGDTKKGNTLQETGRTLKRVAAGLGAATIVALGCNAFGGQDEGGDSVKCGPVSGTRVEEGVLSEDNPYNGFEVTARDGKRVARVVVAASVDEGRTTVDGLQAYHGGLYPKSGWLGSNNEAARPTDEGVLMNPRAISDFTFKEGQGYVATFNLDKGNKVVISAAPPEPGDTGAVKLWATCISK